MVLHLHFVSMT